MSAVVYVAVTAVLIALKLLGVIQVSWLLALSPALVSVALYAAIVFAMKRGFLRLRS